MECFFLEDAGDGARANGGRQDDSEMSGVHELLVWAEEPAPDAETGLSAASPCSS